MPNFMPIGGNKLAIAAILLGAIFVFGSAGYFYTTTRETAVNPHTYEAAIVNSATTPKNDSINIKDFGAVGDGATDDSKAIQAAINAASNSGGGAIFLPPGVYRVNSSITVASKLRLTGAGTGASTIKLGALIGSTGILKGIDVSDVEITHLSIDGNNLGNNSGNGTMGVYISGSGAGLGAARILIDHILVKNTYGRGILLADGTDFVISNSINLGTGAFTNGSTAFQMNDASRSTIANSISVSSGDHAFALAGTSPGSVNSSIVNVFAINPTDQAVDLEDCFECLVQGVTAPGGGQIKATRSRTRIVGNYLENSKDYAIRILDSAAVIADNIIISPVRATTEGFGVYITGSGTDSVVSGNHISGSAHAAIKNEAARVTIANNNISKASQNGITNTGSDVLIEGNVITDVNKNAGGEAAILLASGERVKISDNLIQDTQSAPSTLAGIKVRSGANDAAINGNTINNTKGPGIHIVDTGTHHISNNRITNTGNGAYGNEQAGILISAQTASPSLISIVGNYVSDRSTGKPNNALVFDVSGGFSVSAAVRANRIEGGVLEAGTGAKVLRFAENDGYVTENTGVATIPGGSKNVTVNHGLDRTPAAGDIHISPSNNLGNATKFWISDLTSKNFTITVNTEPGGTGAVFAWSASIR